VFVGRVDMASLAVLGGVLLALTLLPKEMEKSF
jgi:hypothetical protein